MSTVTGPAPAHGGYGTLDEARTVLLSRFGYPNFRPPQVGAIEAVLSGRDALVVLPTGGGKSLCYQVPALMRRGLTVVVSPLIALMKDQVEALERRGVPAAFINSTLTAAHVSDRIRRVRAGSLKLLYLSPERLEARRLLDDLSAIGVALLAVDEAHCISAWGHDFRPSYRRIGYMRERLGRPQTVALTATATPNVRRDIVRQLALREANVVVAGFDRTNLTYHVQSIVGQARKEQAAITWLRTATGPAILYASTRMNVERLTAALVRGGIRATAYHAGLAGTVRQHAQDAFMDERARVIVATSAFGMGIDKPDVRLVLHHAMPGSLEAYYQEAGRAGRDGKRSTVVLLHDPLDRSTHDFFIDLAHPPRPVIERAWQIMRDGADREGFVALSPAVLASRLGPRCDEQRAAAALRSLVASGACAIVSPSPGRISIRLTASPERVQRELVGGLHFEREVLRALWRAAGRQLERGALVDLDGLPPGLGGAVGLVPVLERLEARQIVTWSRTGGGYRLHTKFRDAGWPAIDWPERERRRRADIARLDAMEAYTQTRYCRRAFFLRYFGEVGTRAACGDCDCCLGPAADALLRSGGLRTRPRSSPRF
ncbi:ATP-dependent DNA helicase RecQ [Gemmatimonas sp.]|uniref:RecQ family ATP-dependent DNA helicase n=1 Tax=Gemmatimonas sp. TaxID=1962908 RepID=UPI00391D549B